MGTKKGFAWSFQLELNIVQLGTKNLLMGTSLVGEIRTARRQAARSH